MTGAGRTELTSSTLARLARDPRTGRLRHGAALDLGLRAGLFADLVLGGYLVTHQRAPLPTPALATGNRFLDQLRDAVDERPNVGWVRWYRYVHTDRAAIVNDLVASEQWERAGGRWRPSYRDTDAAAMGDLQRHLLGVAEGRREPVDGYEVALAIIGTMSGAVGNRPRPRALRRELLPLLDHIGVPEDPIRRSLQANLVAASTMIRRARRGRVTA